MSVPENEVLKPRSPALVDNNDWEEFQLSGVEVRDPDTGVFVSVLHAHHLTPVRVTGKLELDDDQTQYLKTPLEGRARSPTIEISESTTHAYGQMEDGEIVFWAAGEAGWFRINPSRAYRETYKGMVEAVEILYFAADVYRLGSKFSTAARSAEGIMKAIAKEKSARYADRHAVATAIWVHREFLFQAMLRGGEGVDWTHTAFFLYAKNKYPEDYQAMNRKVKGKPPKGSTSKSRALGSRSVEPQPSRAASSATSTTTASGLPKKDNNWWESKVIWEMMQKSEIQGLLQPGSITVDACAKIMVRKYEVDDETLAANYIRAHASNLAYMMEHKRRPTIDWLTQPIFAELSSTNLSSAVIKKVIALEVRRRKVPLPDPSPPPPQQQKETEDDSSSEEDIATIRSRARKGKSSVLRPKSNKLAGKGTTRSGKSYLRSSGEEDSDSDAGITSPSKRKSAADANGRSKRTVGRSQFRPSGSATISPPASSDGEDAPLPLQWKAEHRGGAGGVAATPASRAAYTPRVVAEATISFEANSPGDIWVCDFDGCSHRVYGASQEDSQVLIQEHCDLHDERRRAQIELVRLEEVRSQLPVSNLIKRIREMAEHQQSMQLMGLAAGSETKPAFPSPVQRRF